jgi:ribonuclease Y
MGEAEARKLLTAEVQARRARRRPARSSASRKRPRRRPSRKAQLILGAAVQRYASEYVAERTVAVVPLPSDDMKGRIIGREGRNIRALESATGIDLIIDDTPEAVVISCFNPVRREIARLALTRLIADGRIHPTRIEEMVRKATDEVEQQCKEAGDQAAFDLGIGRLHPDLGRLLGKLRFRSGTAQNLLQHSIEVGFLAGTIAGELGYPVKIARRAGLLHDIGCGVDQEVDGSHAVAGAVMARKFGEAPKICHAIEAHHGEVPAEDVLDHIVDAANVLSNQRPGARRESLESYVQRLGRSGEDRDQLRRRGARLRHPGRPRGARLGREHQGQRRAGAGAIQGHRAQGRVAARLPGQIRVSVVRETRAVDFAK